MMYLIGQYWLFLLVALVARRDSVAAVGGMATAAGGAAISAGGFRSTRRPRVIGEETPKPEAAVAPVVPVSTPQPAPTPEPEPEAAPAPTADIGVALVVDVCVGEGVSGWKGWWSVWRWKWEKSGKGVGQEVQVGMGETCRWCNKVTCDLVWPR